MEVMLCFALLNNVGEAMKWQLKIESTEDDCYTLFFLDESRKKIISSAVKAIASVAAALALNQYFPR
jgi:hypothetical protein